MRERGSTLVELLVAVACTSLLAGAVLSLLSDTAHLCQERRGRIEARALAVAAADLLAGELGRAGYGLEGALAIRPGGEAVPVLRRAGEVFAVAYASAPAAEVRVEGDAVYGIGGAAGAAGLGVDAEVAALGGTGPLPLGRVAAVQRRSGGDRLTVDWDGAVPATVRALVPLRRRELGLIADGDTWQLRQRAPGGRWQPSVDGLAQLYVRYGVDDGSDGSIDRWEEAIGDVLPAAIEVAATARLASGALGVAVRRVRR